ncbi:pirin [Spirosoma oryzicola]|uniref:pirin family protein n=1 Tax=Spirosoma oryzicola TaxID=2898794 RepID=UPI001E6045EA|nr:pirin [Spirosoma oryzicola]UHG90990.1 pirin [Spirosoma oryzicola]
MDTQTQAQIYLSDQRGCSQLDSFRSFHSFNFGSYFDESRKPFGPLQLVNDDTLKAGHSIKMTVETDTEVFILPIAGGLEYRSALGDGFLEAGQVQLFSLAAGMTYEVVNPYETEFINFLHIWLSSDYTSFAPALKQTSFDLTNKNELLPINPLASTSASGLAAFIGRYDGRHEVSYSVTKSGEPAKVNGVFVFVISGVFEVQNRLLHERDGLALTDIKNEEVEFEALSNDAILLLLEVSV